MRDDDEVIAWSEGRVGPAADARVPILDHGFLFGDGVFEGIRVTPSGIFRFEDHMKRLSTAALTVGLEVSGGFDRVREAAIETARAWGPQHGYLRLILTRGVGALGIDPASCPEPGIVCLATGSAALSREKDARGLRMVTSSLRRPAPDVLDPRVKSLNYLNNALAKREANLAGVDDALVLNARGLIAEGSATNVFALLEGRLLTPPTTDGALEGVTRRTILEIGPDLGIETREQSLGRFDLYAADAVFLTGTRAGVVPVGELDGSPISQAARPQLETIRAEFAARLEPLSFAV